MFSLIREKDLFPTPRQSDACCLRSSHASEHSAPTLPRERRSEACSDRLTWEDSAGTDRFHGPGHQIATAARPALELRQPRMP
jgi:hypothetical protein